MGGQGAGDWGQEREIGVRHRIHSSAVGTAVNSVSDPNLPLLTPISRPLASSRCFLPFHFQGRLVFPQSQENRLTQLSVSSPFGKSNLTDEAWLQPVAAFHFRTSDACSVSAGSRFRKILKWTFADFQFTELGNHFPQQ